MTTTPEIQMQSSQNNMRSEINRWRNIMTFWVLGNPSHTNTTFHSFFVIYLESHLILSLRTLRDVVINQLFSPHKIPKALQEAKGHIPFNQIISSSKKTPRERRRREKDTARLGFARTGTGQARGGQGRCLVPIPIHPCPCRFRFPTLRQSSSTYLSELI